MHTLISLSHHFVRGFSKQSHTLQVLESHFAFAEGPAET